MTTSYPGGLDNFTNPTSTDTLSSATVPHATQHTNANDAIKAIETELGTNPKGSYASVAARLAASTGSITTWRKAASGGETSLTGTDDFSTTLAYTVGQEQVFINGVLLERGVDYTATTGSSITGLTALVASDIATVISVGTFDVANAIPLSQFTAKGDILVGTGASTEAALNIGADGTTLVANSSASTGVSWAGQPFSQPVLNSAMQIWQRGTSTTATNGNGYFGADRWKVYSGASGRTISQQVTGDTTNLPFIQYCSRLSRDSGGASTSAITYWQNFETINTRPYSGKVVTLSFYARKGANYSEASSNLNAILRTGTGTDQDAFYSGYTGASDVINVNATLTTTWQRFTYSATIPSTATEMAIGFSANFVGTAGAADYVELTGVQIDLGSVALPFRTNSGTLQGELAACQRYYWRWTAGATYARFPSVGIAISSSVVSIGNNLPVTMRVSPTSLDTGGAFRLYDLVSSVYTVSGIALVATSELSPQGWFNVTASGLTSYRMYSLNASNDSTAYIGFSAEL